MHSCHMVMPSTFAFDQQCLEPPHKKQKTETEEKVDSYVFNFSNSNLNPQQSYEHPDQVALNQHTFSYDFGEQGLSSSQTIRQLYEENTRNNQTVDQEDDIEASCKFECLQIPSGQPIFKKTVSTEAKFPERLMEVFATFKVDKFPAPFNFETANFIFLDPVIREDFASWFIENLDFVKTNPFFLILYRTLRCAYPDDKLISMVQQKQKTRAYSDLRWFELNGLLASEEVVFDIFSKTDKSNHVVLNNEEHFVKTSFLLSFLLKTKKGKKCLIKLLSFKDEINNVLFDDEAKAIFEAYRCKYFLENPKIMASIVKWLLKNKENWTILKKFNSLLSLNIDGETYLHKKELLKMLQPYLEELVKISVRNLIILNKSYDINGKTVLFYPELFVVVLPLLQELIDFDLNVIRKDRELINLSLNIIELDKISVDIHFNTQILEKRILKYDKLVERKSLMLEKSYKLMDESELNSCKSDFTIYENNCQNPYQLIEKNQLVKEKRLLIQEKNSLAELDKKIQDIHLPKLLNLKEEIKIEKSLGFKVLCDLFSFKDNSGKTPLDYPEIAKLFNPLLDKLKQHYKLTGTCFEIMDCSKSSIFSESSSYSLFQPVID